MRVSLRGNKFIHRIIRYPKKGEEEEIDREERKVNFDSRERGRGRREKEKKKKRGESVRHMARHTTPR